MSEAKMPPETQGPTEIWTDRLLLRAAEKRDLPFYHKWFSDPEAMKFWSTPPYTTLAQTEEYLNRMVDNAKYNGVTEFSVCLAAASDTDTITITDARGEGASDGSDGAGIVIIGKAGLWDGREIGYIFDRDYWGKGYAFEAIDAILRHVWTLEPPPEVVFADVDPENEVSQRLLMKLGFVKTGEAKNTYETHLGWRDSVFYEARRPTEVENELA